MSGANSVVNVFQNLFSNHGSTFLNIILVVSTIGGQSIIRKLTFACPCSFPLNVYHSLVFIYYRCLLAHNYCPLNTSHHCVNVTVLEYYRSSQEFEKMSGGGSYCPHCICNLDGWDASNLEAQSQIYAWMILLLFGVGTFLVMCIVRMCDKYTYVQRQYVETYKNEETNKFDGVA
ncbi:hypothetical protein OSTOST_16374, partial [Ostertagia ostertagi]